MFPPTDDPLPYDLAVLIAVYAVVKCGRQTLDAYLAAAVVTTGIVIEVVRTAANWAADSSGRSPLLPETAGGSTATSTFFAVRANASAVASMRRA